MLYVTNYLPEELSTLLDRQLAVGMSEPEPWEVKDILLREEWQSLIEDKTVAETLGLLLNMKIPAVSKREHINFKDSDRLLVFLLQQTEEEIESKKITVSYYKFVYVHLHPITEEIQQHLAL